MNRVFITGGDGEYLKMAEVMTKSLLPYIGDNHIRVYSFDCDYEIEGIECIRINLPYPPTSDQIDPISISQVNLDSYWGKYDATIHALGDYEYCVWIDSDCFVTSEINRIWNHCDRARDLSFPLYMHYFLGDAAYWFRMDNSEIEVSGKYGAEASYMFDVIRNPFGQLAAAGLYLSHRNHVGFLEECISLRLESLNKSCYYYADDKAFSEERLTNICLWKNGHKDFLPFTWINHLTEKNLDRFPDQEVKKILEFGFDIMFDREDNSIIAIHGPNKFNLEKNAENLDSIRSSFVTPVDKLMIVAHPDDEAIFGGQSLLEERGWRVVCLTNKNNQIRSEEMKYSMHGCGVIDYFIYDLEDILDSPLDPERVSSIIEEHLGEREWKKIVTHNNIGEYGHPHHYQIHNEIKKKISNLDNFWVFDKRKEKIDNKILERKNKVLERSYVSQKEIISQIRENRGRWFIDKDMETNYIENGIISRYENSSTREEEFIACYLK